MDVEKIVAEERAQAARERAEEERKNALLEADFNRELARAQAVWPQVRDAVRVLPEVEIVEQHEYAQTKLKRAGERRGDSDRPYATIGVSSRGIDVTQLDTDRKNFEPKDWEKAVDHFARIIARMPRY